MKGDFHFSSFPKDYQLFIKKSRERLISYEDITILPISEDPDAQEIPLPETDSDSSEASEVIEIIDAIEEIEE